MTVYNITNLIGFDTMQAIKKYLNVNKLTLLYSDWLNDFGLYTKESYDPKKKERCIKYLIKKYNLMNYKINILKKYPIIRKNFHKDPRIIATCR